MGQGERSTPNLPCLRVGHKAGERANPGPNPRPSSGPWPLSVTLIFVPVALDCLARRPCHTSFWRGSSANCRLGRRHNLSHFAPPRHPTRTLSNSIYVHKVTHTTDPCPSVAAACQPQMVMIRHLAFVVSDAKQSFHSPGTQSSSNLLYNHTASSPLSREVLPTTWQARSSGCSVKRARRSSLHCLLLG